LALTAKPKPDGTLLARQKLGLELEQVSEQTVRRMGLRKANGLLITSIADDGPAAKAGLEGDDILVRVERSDAQNADDLGLLLENVMTGQPVRITALRIANRRLYRIQTRITAR
jgi:serine protease Do